MKHVNEARLENDLEYRFQYLSEFMGFGAEDVATIHGAAALIAPAVSGLVDAVYVKLFQYDATKRHFVPQQSGYAGALAANVDTLALTDDVIQFRKQHLSRYLVALVTRPYDSKMVTYLDFVGKIHTPKAGSRDLDVPLVQMNALLGFVSTALIGAILGLGLEKEHEVRAIAAFNKLLWIQNDLISRHYQAAQTAAA